jgi:hypothetical protein
VALYSVEQEHCSPLLAVNSLMASTDSEDDDGEFIPGNYFIVLFTACTDITLYTDSLSDSTDDEHSEAEHNGDNNTVTSPELDESERKKYKMTARLSIIDTQLSSRARDKLWAEFQASVAVPPVPSVPEEQPKNLVKVVKRYRFAGEDVMYVSSYIFSSACSTNPTPSDVVEVPEDSPDAKKWPLWQEDSTTTTPLSPPPPSTSMSKPTPLPKSRPPGPRKPKTSLTSLPTLSSQKPKKLSTLDKSAMDWRAHIDSQQDSTIKHELEANRRGGGYLEKVEFLKRVEERKEDTLDAIKSRKRRKL